MGDRDDIMVFLTGIPWEYIMINIRISAMLELLDYCWSSYMGFHQFSIAMMSG